MPPLPNCLIAIDPGLDASSCVFRPLASARSGLRWVFLDVPTREEGTKRRIDVPKFRDFVRRHSPDRAFIENINMRPGQAAGGMGRFLRATGSLTAVIECCDVPLVEVVPQKWRKHHGIEGFDSKTEAKEASRLLALRLEPSCAPLLARKMDHGRSEALLLALYGAAMLELL